MTTQEIAVIESKVMSLRERAEAIQVRDQPSYIEACQIVKAGRAEIKAIGFVLDPGIGSAKEHLDKLKSDKQKFVAQVEPVVKLAETKAEMWVRQERESAQREQDRLNEKARLEARTNHSKTPMPVEVKAAVPTVAGIRKLTLWKYRYTNPDLVPDAFWMLDDASIGRMVRETKNKEKAEKLCPGIEVYNEESI
jgi:hypothetical protein